MPAQTDSLLEQAKCFKCIPDGAQPQVQTYLLDQLRNALTAGWDDLVFSPVNVSVTGGTNTGLVVVTSGQSNDQAALRLNELTNTNKFWVPVQMPHTWVPGTRVYPHVHLQPQDNSAHALLFNLTYQISDIGSVFPTSTSVLGMSASIPANNAYRHMIFGLPSAGIDMSAFVGPSTILRLDYTLTSGGPMDLLSFDLHIFKSISPVPFNPASP